MAVEIFLRKGWLTDMRAIFQAGYTMIELIVVIAIMAILLTLAIPAFQQFNAPQEFKTVSQQIKSDLRTLQNKAVTGVTVLRGGQNTRVYWTIRILNNANTYEIAACEKSETNVDSYSECTNKETVRLNSKFSLNVASSYTGYIMQFSPVSGAITAYDAARTTTDFDSTGNMPINSAFPITWTITSTTASLNGRALVLLLNSNGSLTETCKKDNVIVSCT
jgi:prepilin-type N-terminal cleavage/methylation domain-containing protein